MFAYFVKKITFTIIRHIFAPVPEKPVYEGRKNAKELKHANLN